MIEINFEDLKELPPLSLLSLAKKAQMLWLYEECDQVAMHHIINAVSYQKYGIEDVVRCRDTTFNNVKSIIFCNRKIILEE